MTDYRNKFTNSGQKITLTDSLRKEELFDISGNKIIQSISDNSYLGEAESERFIKSYIKQRSRYIPQLDYSDPASFCFYGSAERYYKDSIDRVYNTYPYDGSKAEKMEWSLTASYLDLYMLEHEYPKSKGHVTFTNDGWGTRSAVDGVYGLSSAPEYIYFVGGPHSGTMFNSSKKRESNLKVDGSTGNTAEFWLKKQSFVGSSLTTREVLFDVHTSGAISGSSTYGRFMLSLDSAVNSTTSPFKLSYVSGTTGLTDQVLGTTSLTKATVADNAWHHYAVSVVHSGSSLISKMFVDGVLEDINTASIASFGSVDRNFVGTIGSLATASNGVGKLGYGKLSGSMDEFRYWKTARTEKQIGRYFYRPVHGGTDKDNNNPELGLYYKFNEGIIGAQSYDEVVLDYSGRIGNGKVIGWSSGFRSSTSGVESSTNLPESSYLEPGDPVINGQNSDVQALLTKFENFGKSHDGQNGSSLANTVPSYFMQEDKTGLMGQLVQIIAATLDDIFLKIKFLPNIKDYNYQDFFNQKGVQQSIDTNSFLLGCEDATDYKFTGNHSKPWINYILEHFGLATTEIFPNADLIETFLQKSDKLTFEQNLHEVKNAILSNIHSNLIHIYNTKGTEKSFRNLIRCFGVDDELIKLNVYGNNEVYKLEKKPIYTTVKHKSLNFANTNYQGTLYQTASNKLYMEQRYITSSTSPKPLTIEANIIFPDNNSITTNLQTASLFGMHSVQGASGSNDALTWHSLDSGSMQAYFVRRSNFKSDGHFFLTSSAGAFTAVSSKSIAGVYDNTHWNISVRVAKKGDIDFGLAKLSGSTGYKIEFSGYNYDLDVLRNSFYVTSSITQAGYEMMSRLDRAVYAGSHKTNFTGSHLHSSDIRLLGLNVHLDGLTDAELKEHAKNPAVFGRTDPQHVSNFDDGSNLRAADATVLRWQFENLVSSSAGGTLSVLDFTSGSLQTPSGSLTGYKYPGAATGFTATGSAIVQEFIPSVEYAPIDNVYSSDRVQIKSTEVEKFTAGSRPVTYFYSFEKSMYQVISKEMINMFAGITGMSNLIGEPVNKYRQEYKLMEKMKEKFFRNVENDMDLDKFVEYYKWIDSSLSHFVQQLVPASSNFAGRIRDIVESHALERNKYKHQAPTVEYKDPTVSPGNILGVNELLYDWEHGHAPLQTSHLTNVKAILLDGTNDVVVVSDQDAFSPTDGSTDKAFSISAWVYVGDVSADNGPFVAKSNNTIATRNEYIFKHDNGEVQFFLYDSALSAQGNAIRAQADAATLSDATWHHVVATYDGSTNASGIKIYTDASQTAATNDEAGTYVKLRNTATPLTFGATEDAGNANRVFEDMMADVVIFDKELTASEVTELRNGGKVININKFSALSNVISWFKMGDDLDAAGSGGIRDYVGGYHGTLTNGAAIVASTGLASDREVTDPKETTNCLWQKDRSERSSDRETIRRVAVTDVSGSTYVLRKLTRPYRFSAEQSRPIGTGFNRKTNKNPELYKMATRAGKIELAAVTEEPVCKDIIDPNFTEHYRGSTNNINNNSYLDADSDLLFPFTMISSSVGVDLEQVKENLQIANNHLDIGLTGEQSLQSPFTRQHVGGMPHRKVEMGLTGSDVRPEAYNLTASNSTMVLTTASIDSPKSMFYRDGGAGAPYMFKNVKHGTGSNILGNYNKDYEIVQTSGRSLNNSQFVADDGLNVTPVSSKAVSGTIDFVTPVRQKTGHVIVNKFSSPGGPETQGAFASDQESQEYSIYNSLNYRNSVVRNTLNKLSAEQSDQFGYRSGSTTQASVHMTNRNASRRTGSLGKEVNFDNSFVRHPIPQNDYQYSWVTASVGDSSYDFLARNNNMGHVSNFSLHTSKYSRSFAAESSGSIPSDFSTNQSERTASYVDIDRVQTVTESPANASYRFGSQVSISHDVLVVVNNHTSVPLETGLSTLYIFRSGTAGYVQEFSSVVAVSDEKWGVGGSADDQAAVMSISNHGSWVACAVSGGASTSTPDCIKIFRSSSSGWALNEGLTGSAIKFKGISRIALTASTAGVYRLAAINTGSVRIFTHNSASGWYNSGANVTDLTSVTTHSPATVSNFSYGYMAVYGDLATATSRVVVGNKTGFSVLVSGSGWSEEDTIVPSDWTWKPYNGYADTSFGLNQEQDSSNYRNNIALHDDVFGIITETLENDLTPPANFQTPSIQIWKRSGANWSLYEEKDASSNWSDFSDHTEDSNSRIMSIALDKGLMFLGVTERDILFDGEEFDYLATENDFGSVYVYADNGTTYTKQRELYSNAPVKNLGLGNSLACKGGKLAAGAPSNSVYWLHRNPVPEFKTKTEDTSATVFDYAQTTQTDKTSLGPKIVGSSTEKAFGFVGQSSYFGEVEQIPRVFASLAGEKVRVIEKKVPVTQRFSEFCIEIEYIEGSLDSLDISNSQYGLNSVASGPFLVQYKLGSGLWKNSSILINSGPKQSFNKARSTPIKNDSNVSVSIRILNVTEDHTRNEWAFKSLDVVQSREAFSSPSQLIRGTSSRNSLVHRLHNSMPALYFNGFAQELSSSVPNEHDIYFTADGQGGADQEFSVHMWLKPEVEIKGTRSVFDLQSNYQILLSSSADNPDFLDISFICYSGTAGTLHKPYYQNRLGAKKTQAIKNREWSHIVATYNGSKEESSFGLHINNTAQQGLQKVTSMQSSYKFHGMAGGGSRTAAATQQRNLGFGSPIMYSEGSTAAAGTDSLLFSYQGFMSNFSIFDKKLSTAEVAELYNLKNNVTDYTIQQGDPLLFRKTSVFTSNAVLWFPFTGLGSSSAASQHDTLYADQVNGQVTLNAPYAPNDPLFYLSLIPQLRRTNWTVANTSKDLLVSSADNRIENRFSATGSYLQNTLSPYSWPTWKQLRGSEHPITRAHRKDNTISIAVRGSEVMPSVHNEYLFDFNKDLQNISGIDKKTVDRTFINYTEPMVTNRFNPMTITLHNEQVGGLSLESIRLMQEEAYLSQREEENVWNLDEGLITAMVTSDTGPDGITRRPVDNRLLVLRKTYQNDLTSFANANITDKLGIDDFKRHTFNDLLLSYQREFSTDEGTTMELNYVETIYPREENTYTKNARLRENFQFFGWNSSRTNRSIILTGSNTYNSSLVTAGTSNLFPEITVDKDDYQRTNPFFVDTVDSNSSVNPTRFTHVRASTWPLDARETFSRRPLSITSSFFNEGKDFLPFRKQGQFGEGVLQNDYSIFGLGVNTVHGTPPPAPIYSRRIPQTYSGSTFLAGEAKWEAADQSGQVPFVDSYEEYREKIRTLGQDHSIVPEFRISEFIEDTIKNNDGDFLASTSISENFLSLTGAIYNQSSGDLEVGSSFFKTYATSDFMKYFNPVVEQTDIEGFKNDVDPMRLTLKCQAAMKFIPYRGFYPAERVLQIAELFGRGYMSDFSFTNTQQDTRISQTNSGVRNLLERKIRANLQQSIKPLMAPGILFNSIKSGMAVDYPLFGSNTDIAAAQAFGTNLDKTAALTGAFGGQLEALVMFTGSMVNQSTMYTGSVIPSTPRLSGSVYKRVTFEDLLEPDRLKGTTIIDNEPHASASIYYGNSDLGRVMDYPFKFGQIDSIRTEQKLNADSFSLKRPLSETLVPYKMAINNFCAETVNFFLEDGSSATLESDEVEVRLAASTAYKMRVYVRNKDLTMYDRHSAFGPPVDEGRSVTKAKFKAQNIVISGSGARKDMGFLVRNYDLASGSSNIPLDNSLPGIVMTGSGGNKVAIKFVTASVPSTTNITNNPGNGTTAEGTFNATSLGNIYLKGTSSYIDVKSIKTNFADPFGVKYDQDTNQYRDHNRSSALAQLIKYAVNVIAHNSSSGIVADVTLKQVTDKNLFPADVPSDATYLRYNLEFAQTANATASAGASWRNIKENSTGSATMPQSRAEHWFESYPVSGSRNFIGGAANSTVSKLTHKVNVTDHDGHGYAPYHPPFLDKNAEPYVEISFTPSSAGTYTLDQIWEGATFTYNNFYQDPSNANTAITKKNNANFNHAMAISASIDLKSFVQYQAEENAPGSNREGRKRWVIQSKWETPVLQFANVTASALKLSDNTVHGVTNSPWQNRTWTRYFSQSLAASDPYLTASTGMWHQYGALPAKVGEGYELAIEEIEGLDSSKQLARLVGFTSANKRSAKATPGRISEFKEIAESVVAIPYYVTDDDQVEFFDISEEIRLKARTLNEGRKRQLENGTLTSDEYDKLFNTPGSSPTLLSAYQMRMMEKYVMPPQFDFVTYPEMAKKSRPMMYVFQFRAAMKKQDLQNIWQNLSPTSAVSTGKARYSATKANETKFGLDSDIQYVSHFLDVDKTPFEGSDQKAFLKEKVRWIVFKVKMRAEKDLSKIKRDSLPGLKSGKKIVNTSIKDSGYFYKDDSNDPVVNDSRGVNGLKYKHSFNWPYDYFSMVELIKIESKVDFLPKPPNQRN